MPAGGLPVLYALGPVVLYAASFPPCDFEEGELRGPEKRDKGARKCSGRSAIYDGDEELQGCRGTPEFSSAADWLHLFRVEVFLRNVVLGHFLRSDLRQIGFRRILDAANDSRLERLAFFQKFFNAFGIRLGGI
jgi:hypothetical protein